MDDATSWNTRLYAIRLLAPEPGALSSCIAGRVEHVLSGRRQDFADDAALLAWLVQQQATAQEGSQ